MIRTSEQIEMLSAAFVQAQAKFGAAIKASQNPAFRSKYADLASVIDATLEHLNAEGIGVMQHPALTWTGEGDTREAYVTVTTRMQHASGQWWESDTAVPAVQRDRFDAQSVGSAITYACRYALRSICTVPQADDDANEASGIGSKAAAEAVVRGKLQEGAKSKDAKIKALAEEGLKKLDSASLFYAPTKLTSDPEGDWYVIGGDSELKTANKDILGKHWNNVAKEILVTGEQLEGLKYQLENRKVPFALTKGAS